ncbi:hypothetical protein P7C73_g6440, partial [Tremellales sp. Uapishka_1]
MQEEQAPAFVTPAAAPLPEAPASSGVTTTSTLTVEGHEIKVFGAALTSPPTPAEIDEAFFEPSLSDVQAHHASVVSRSHRLNDAPLLTSKHRDEEKEKLDKKKEAKWPTTTIRIKFSDSTQIESTFPSTSAIQPVYAFVRSTLNEGSSSKPFVLYQPPRSQYPEHPVPVKKPVNPHKASIIPPANYGPVRGGSASQLQGGKGGKESLNELGLVPQSILLVRWEDDEMNASGYPAPLLPELMATIVPLPSAVVKPPIPQGKAAGKKPADGEKKIPKWLQKGLMKKK